MEKQKNNNGLIVLVIVLSLLVLGLGGYIVYDKVISQEKLTDNSNISQQPQKKLTTEELLDQLVGEWGSCKDNSSCYGKIIEKRENGEYYYTSFVWQTDGDTSGTIKKAEYIEKDIYLLTVYYPTYENEIDSEEEHTDEYKIDISEVSSNIIYIDGIKNQKITTDRDSFFNSIK